MSTASQWARLPKADLHRHLEGSIRVDTLVDIAREAGLPLPGGDREGLRRLVQMTESDRDFASFLAKFSVLRGFFVSPEAIERVAREAALDAAADGVRYLELRFNPVALASTRGLPFELVADRVAAGVRSAEAESDVTVRLIASINRAEPESSGEILNLAIAEAGGLIAGIDLAGDEVNAGAETYVGHFEAAREAGLGICVHAGEWGGVENVRFAIEELGATRIGHGVRIVDDPEVVALARDRGTVFEVCVTSNVQTHAVPSLHEHPVRAMQAEHGLIVTLNTDDPWISDITLSGEFALAEAELGFGRLELEAMTHAALRHGFLAEADRRALAGRFESEFSAARA